MRKERVGFAVCGSFCTHQQVLKALEALVEEYETVIPIVSENAAFTDTRFGTSDALMERLAAVEQSAKSAHHRLDDWEKIWMNEGRKAQG